MPTQCQNLRTNYDQAVAADDYAAAHAAWVLMQEANCNGLPPEPQSGGGGHILPGNG